MSDKVEKKVKNLKNPETFLKELQERSAAAVARIEAKKKEAFDLTVQNILDEVLDEAYQASERSGVCDYKRNFYVGYCTVGRNDNTCACNINFDLIKVVAGRLSKEYGLFTNVENTEESREKGIILSFSWDLAKIEAAKRMEYNERMEMAID